MKNPTSPSKRGFTLVETIIAIGVLTVLLTGFIIVFAPAAAGIKKTINLQEADRLTSTLELELVTLRGEQQTTDYKIGFAKAFEWIKNSNKGATKDALLVYQYRASLEDDPRTADGTPQPVANIEGLKAGKNYVVQSMARRQGDDLFSNDGSSPKDDLPAVEGGIYLVKCTQLVLKAGVLQPGEPGKIFDSTGSAEVPTADAYPDAVITFTADFYALPQKSKGYFTGGGFDKTYQTSSRPVFSRNLAVRR